MQSMQFETRKSERGFTLVELAIVMIIIGLLIGGILKGQELIANAQVGATVAQIKGIDAATTTFRDKYDAFPGDMQAATTRLVNCTGSCASNGNGNNRLTGLPSIAPAGESVAFFGHLAAAQLVTDVSTAGAGTAWGQFYPAAKISGGFQPGYTPGTAALGTNATPAAGHYLAIVRDAGTAPANTSLTPNEASRIDIKLDDGVPNSGTVVASTGGTCSAGAAGYTEITQGEVCDLFVRFQN